jgi:hypothetical protein
MALLMLIKCEDGQDLARFEVTAVKSPSEFMAVLPTRLVPGAIMGAAFACVGLETGLLNAVFLRGHAAIPTHWICGPLFALALFYVRHIWRDGAHTHPVRCITALSPRLQAVIFTLCLATGFTAGALISFLPRLH